MEMKWLKLLWPEGYLLLFWLAILMCGFWVFKLLLQASLDPVFGAGIVGGAVWMLVVSQVWRAVNWAMDDFLELLKKTRAASGMEDE
jgi:hypothetical protein